MIESGRGLAAVAVVVLALGAPAVTGEVGQNNESGPGTSDNGGARTSNEWLDMIVLMDRSGSMAFANWTGAVSGLTGFLNDSSSADACAWSAVVPPMACQGLLYWGF
jgi:hypothetical protein